jgi:hypothetical protein
MTRSYALLSPARFERTCAVEIPIVQGLRASQTFRARVERIARDYQDRETPQAIPSWGQHYRLGRSTVERIYGRDLDRWRRVLRRLSGEDAPPTFRTAFSIERGLEYDLPTLDPRCFIVTAACGDPAAPEVEALREVRERVLRPSRLGRAVIRGYERAAPPWAARLEARPRAARLVRTLAVKPAAWMATRVLRG